MMWPGVEPVQGEVNQTYLTVMENIVNTLGTYGIYTIVGIPTKLNLKHV
jgi:hypothetical protein